MHLHPVSPNQFKMSLFRVAKGTICDSCNKKMTKSHSCYYSVNEIIKLYLDHRRKAVVCKQCMDRILSKEGAKFGIWMD